MRGAKRSRSGRWPRSAATLVATAFSLAFSLVALVPTACLDAVLGDRQYCRAWHRLEQNQKLDRLVAADVENVGPQALTDPCFTSARARAFQLIDYECTNWPRLMDFEVRALLSAAQEHCFDDVWRGLPGAPADVPEPEDQSEEGAPDSFSRASFSRNHVRIARR